MSLWAGVFSLAMVAVKRLMPRLRARSEQVRAQHGAEGPGLPLVGDRDGHLGGFRLGVVPHEAGDRDQAARRSRRGTRPPAPHGRGRPPP